MPPVPVKLPQISYRTHVKHGNCFGALLISTTTMSTNADDSINNNHLNGDEEVEDAEDDEAVDTQEAGAGTGAGAGAPFNP